MLRRTGVNLHRQAGVNLNRQPGVNFVVFCNIQENGTLPGVPSAEEVADEGINLGRMDATLLKKVEEITLYLIEHQKKLEILEKENQQLRQELKSLKDGK